MSTAIAQKSTATQLSEWVKREDVHERLAAAVGKTMNTDTFIAHVMTAFQEPSVKACTPISQFRVLHELAAMCLVPTLKQVALVVRNGKNGFELSAMPQWQGYKAVMERHPAVLEITAFLVHNLDKFSFTKGVPNHDWDPFDPKRTFTGAKDIKGGYAKIEYTDGRTPKYHMVSAENIRKAQACAQTQIVWNKWYEQMALKTVYRDVFNRRACPVDPLVEAQLCKIESVEDSTLGNDPQRVGSNERLPSLSHQTSEPECDPDDILTINGEVQGSMLDEEGNEVDISYKVSHNQDEITEAYETFRQGLADAKTVGECQSVVKSIDASTILPVGEKMLLREEAEARINEIRGNRGERTNQ